LINFKLNLINFFKNPTNNEKLECMEYICDKIIFVTKFEKIAYIFQNYGCEWNYWVNFFMAYDIDVHELNLIPFRYLKFLDVNSFKKCVFFILNNKCIVIFFLGKKKHYHIKEEEIL